MPDLVIAFTVSGQRQKYLRQALNSWARVRGISDARLVFCVEPDPVFPVPEFTAWTAAAFPGSVVQLNITRLGCAANTRNAFDSAFALGARLAVMAEEDLVVSADVLEYLIWATETYEHDPGTVAVCAHARSSRGASPAAVVRSTWFNPLVCGTWKDRWESYLRPGWGGYPGNPQGWDVRLQHLLRADAKQAVFPVMSRVLHIGEFSTMIAPQLASHLYTQSRSDCFCPDYPPQDYREVAFTADLSLLV